MIYSTVIFVDGRLLVSWWDSEQQSSVQIIGWYKKEENP